MLPSGPTRLSSHLVLLLIGVGIAVGAAAVLVVGPSPRIPPPPSVGGQLEIHLPLAAVGLLCLAPFLVGFGALFYRRLNHGAARLPGRVLAVALVMLMLLLLFILVVRGSGGSGAVTYVGGSPPANNTTGAPNNTTPVGATGGPTIVGWTIPSWGVWVLVAAVAALMTVVMAAALAVRRPAPAPRETLDAGEVSETRAALEAAAVALDQGADPRLTILALYARLLAQVGPLAGDLEPWTPEEIRVARLAGLGLSGPAMTTLTRLFEEARYSSHPMGPGAARRASEAIRVVEQQLARPASGS
jgi:hypothetical protein